MTPCKPGALCWFGQRLKARFDDAQAKYEAKPTEGYKLLFDYTRAALNRHVTKVCRSSSCFWCEGTGGFGIPPDGWKDCWSCKGTGEFVARAKAVAR